jgi:hypothetical protein
MFIGASKDNGGDAAEPANNPKYTRRIIRGKEYQKKDRPDTNKKIQNRRKHNQKQS